MTFDYSGCHFFGIKVNLLFYNVLMFKMQSNSLEKRFGNKQYDDKNSTQNHKKLVRKFLTSKYQHFFSNERK